MSSSSDTNRLDRPQQASDGKQMQSRRDRIGVAIILVGTFWVFRLCPVHTVYDSHYEMLFSQQLLWHQSFSVSAWTIPELQSHQPGQIHRCCDDLPYQLVQVGERFYHYYPPGNIILPMPFVALANAIGISAIDQDGRYNLKGDEQMQKTLAALLMATLAVVIFLTARLILPFEWSLLISAATAFGTQVWSTASRAMWSHTPGILILGVAVFLIIRAETKGCPLRPVLLGTCLSWLYFIRPTFSLSIIAIGIYVLLYHRASLLPFVLTGCLWLAAFIVYSEYHFGHLLPPYYNNIYKVGALSRFGERLAGVLISPSRGLLIYVPVLIVIGYLLVRYRSTSTRRLVNLAAAVVIAHVLLIATFAEWHGGGSYGPRLLTDVVPWFALLGMLAVEARLRWRAAKPAQDTLWHRRIEMGTAAVVLACSITVNAMGAISRGTEIWNGFQALAVDQWYRNLWDWRHPQFMGTPPDWVAFLKQKMEERAQAEATDVNRTRP